MLGGFETHNCICAIARPFDGASVDCGVFAGQLIREKVNHMPLILNLEHLTPADIRFIYSPFHEMLLSLHTLHDYRHHPLHINWAMAMRREFTLEQWDTLRKFGFFFDKLLGLSWEALYHDQMETCAKTFKRFKAIPDDAFFEVFATALAMNAAPAEGMIQPKWTLEAFADNQSLVAKAKTYLTEHYPASVEMLEQLLHDPAAMREDLSGLLSIYWTWYFGPQWREYEALFRRDIANRGRLLFDAGVAAMFPTLGKEFVARDDTTVVMTKSTAEHTITYAANDEIWLFPSYFLWPHVVFSHSEDVPRSSMIVYALPDIAREARPPMTPEDLLQTLQATANHTRLQILKLLRTRGRSTKELSSILQLSEAAVSKHLKVLERAGWISGARLQYYVVYGLHQSKLDALDAGLRQFLFGDKSDELPIHELE